MYSGLAQARPELQSYYILTLWSTRALIHLRNNVTDLYYGLRGPDYVSMA